MILFSLAPEQLELQACITTPALGVSTCPTHRGADVASLGGHLGCIRNWTFMKVIDLAFGRTLQILLWLKFSFI
jgi:hypothetical protein